MVSTDPTTRFSVAVVGKGMIGSAAARHLSRQSDGAALIGPDEPAVLAEHHDVFGSHYDEGRIYRILDGDLIWGRLAERAAPRQGPTRVLKPLVSNDEFPRRRGFGRGRDFSRWRWCFNVESTHASSGPLANGRLPSG